MASTAWLLYFGGPNMEGYSPTMVLPYGFSQMNSIVLLAICLFIVAGGIMEKGRIGEKLIDFVEVFVGRIKGGLGVVATVSCAVFGSITGSGCATLSCIGSIMFPRLKESGYPRGHSAALLANSAVLGMLIPPSSIMILYSWIGGQSVLASFLATVVPGIILTTLLSIVNIFLLRKNTTMIIMPPQPVSETIKQAGSKGKIALPALLMPVIVLGGIYGGIMTPTEAAAVACLYAVPVGFFIYKGLTWRSFLETLKDSAVTTGVIMVMLYAVMMLSRLYIMEDLPGKMLVLLQSVSTNRYVILFMINIFLIIMGMLMDDISSVMLTTPILLPIILELGFSPIHYAAIVGVNTGLGNITPPTAPMLYLSGRIGESPINETLMPTLWMILFAWLPTLAITTYYPGLSMWLPRLILGS
jgi:tripartite ATP-independent transporter DctM subunit